MNSMHIDYNSGKRSDRSDVRYDAWYDTKCLDCGKKLIGDQFNLPQSAKKEVTAAA